MVSGSWAYHAFASRNVPNVIHAAMIEPALYVVFDMDVAVARWAG